MVDKKKPPHQWSRSHFSMYPRCDILLNNICESFNSLILDEREKPIIQLLEGIRNLLMTRMQINREKAAKWVGPICPNIKNMLDKIILKAAECIPMRSDEWHFQVMGPFDQHTVDLWERTCSCRRMDLTGIPCKHAVSSIWSRKETPETYVHPCYSVNSYLSCYENTIYGTNSSELWPSSNNIAPLPPTYAELIGRPKKLRKREPNEPPAASHNPHRLRGVKRTNKCKTCGDVGHNSKTCSKRTMGESARDNREVVSNEVNDQSQSIIATARSNGLQGTQVSISIDHVQQKKASNREKLQVRRPEKNMQTTGMANKTTSINHSSSISRTPVIVKRGKNFVTLSNLKSSASNLTNVISSQAGSTSCCSDPKDKSK
ncbi:uncharacterized protein [Henckelia pumila]|uniref:uncharacterized protein n=1 Tax=Henckelia pumila TaxID=405737 RepID=UPI003C6E8D67